MFKPNYHRNKRAAAVLISLGLYFLAVLSAGVFSTISETNKVDLQRNTRLVETAMQSQLSTLQAMANDNGLWDSAAEAVYEKNDPKPFFEASFATSTEGNASYQMIAVVDAQANMRWGEENGKPVQFDPQPRFGLALEKILLQISDENLRASGIAADSQGPVLLSAARIRYTAGSKNAELKKRGFNTLIVMRRVDSRFVRELGKNLQLDDLSLSQKPKGPSSFALNAADGKVIGYLTWATTSTGFAAFKETLPLLIVGSILFFISLAFTGRTGHVMLKRLEAQAMTDSLSQMPNRRALLLAIREEQKRSCPHALALLDLDGFKYVNDSYGHAVGDRLIKLVAKMLKEEIGNDGMVARLGGDEFAILISGRDVMQQIEAVSARFLGRLKLPVMIEERSLSMGASIGLAATDQTLIGEGELLRRADVAMYQAKQLGKMRAEWYDPKLDEEQATANELAAELRHSIGVGELEVVYQPIVEVGDARCRSVEALARWNSPTRGAIAPDIFIPIAEKTGLIDAIGLFVLRKACNDVRDWDDLRLAVNVSAAQLRNPMFPAELQAILAETNFDPKRLELEITETYLIADTSLAQKVIEGVTALGVTISLDDFGTGYASIGFLRQFAFGKLKIDRSLVFEAQHDEAARMLVQVSVAAARALNMIVTAEGVETQAQADLMKVAGCDQLQGWFYGRPMECGDLAVILNDAAALRALVESAKG